MYTIKEYLEKAYGIRKDPSYIAARCTGRKSAGDNCNICSQVCPMGIYPSGKRKRPVWDQCAHCGICSAACPARCISPPQDRANNFIMAAAKKGPLTVCCEEEEGAFRLSVRCIAAVAWEQLAFSALNGGVVISLRECGKCGEGDLKTHISDNLKKLKLFLGEELYKEKVTVLSEGDEEIEVPEEGVSRRDILSFFGNLPIDRAFSIMPKLGQSEDIGLFYRGMLRDAVKEASESEEGKGRKYGVYLPRFTQKCYNCGYCVKACPNEALKMIKTQTGFTVAVDVWRCTGCGICKNICRSGGIAGISAMRVGTMETVALARLEDNLCPKCGKPFPRDTGEEICHTCVGKRQFDEKKMIIAARKGPAETENANEQA